MYPVMLNRAAEFAGLVVSDSPNTVDGVEEPFEVVDPCLAYEAEHFKPIP